MNATKTDTPIYSNDATAAAIFFVITDLNNIPMNHTESEIVSI